MAAEQSRRSLKIRISNKTQNVTLKNPRILKNQTSACLKPELPPGSNDSCRFFSDSDSLDIGGLVVYEAESFTLAILVCFFMERDVHSHLLHLELSLSKAHLGDLDNIFFRVITGRDPPKADKIAASRCTFSGKSGGYGKLSTSLVNVTATVSHNQSPLLKVVLEGSKNSEVDLAAQNSSCRIL